MSCWRLEVLHLGRQGLCGEVRLILGSRIGASPKSTTGQEDRTEEKKAGGASRMYLSPTSVPSLPL